MQTFHSPFAGVGLDFPPQTGEKVSPRHQHWIAEQSSVSVQLPDTHVVQFHPAVCHAVTLADDLLES
jgi:hypothetical protein